MAVANGKLNFIFLAEPHTASRAVRDALLKLEGSCEVGTHHHQIGDLIKSNYVESFYKVFSVIRNPADIMVTLWLQSGNRPREYPEQNFAKYIRYWGAKKLDSFFFTHAKSVDQVIRYENLQKELNSLLRSLKAPSVRLEVVGPTEGKEPWFRYYTLLDLQYILWGYPEIAQWGYSKVIYQQIEAKYRKLT